MYKEIRKYKTGEKESVKSKIANVKGNPTIIIEMEVYNAGLGDLLYDFIKHVKKPWWRRRYYHDRLTSIYKKWLNLVELTEYFQ